MEAAGSCNNSSLVLFLSCRQPLKLANPIPGLQPSDPAKGNLGDVGELGTFDDFQQRYHTKCGGFSHSGTETPK